MWVKRVSIWEVSMILLHMGQSRAELTQQPVLYSSIYLAFCNSQCRKWNSEKCIFVRNFAVAGNLIDSLVKHNSQPHTWQRTFGTKEKGNLKAHASQQGTTIVETGKPPFGALEGLLNIHINNQWSGCSIWTWLISVQLLIIYSLKFLCFLGRVYLRYVPIIRDVYLLNYLVF